MISKYRFNDANTYSSGSKAYLCFPPIIICVSTTMQQENITAPSEAQTTIIICDLKIAQKNPNKTRHSTRTKRIPFIIVKSILVCNAKIVRPKTISPQMPTAYPCFKDIKNYVKSIYQYLLKTVSHRSTPSEICLIFTHKIKGCVPVI